MLIFKLVQLVLYMYVVLSQVIVEFKATFLKITDIDTISQQFEAEVFLQAKWEEIGLAGADSKVKHSYWLVLTLRLSILIGWC